MYRLHIDIPCGDDLEFAKQIAEHFIEFLRHERSSWKCEGVDVVQARLVQDGERSNSNYLNYDPDTDRFLSKKVQV